MRCGAAAAGGGSSPPSSAPDGTVQAATARCPGRAGSAVQQGGRSTRSEGGLQRSWACGTALKLSRKHLFWGTVSNGWRPGGRGAGLGICDLAPVSPRGPLPTILAPTHTTSSKVPVFTLLLELPERRADPPCAGPAHPAAGPAPRRWRSALKGRSAAAPAINLRSSGWGTPACLGRTPKASVGSPPRRPRSPGRPVQPRGSARPPPARRHGAAQPRGPTGPRGAFPRAQRARARSAAAAGAAPLLNRGAAPAP